MARLAPMRKIGPKEAALRAQRAKLAEEQPEPAVSDPNAVNGHRDYMKTYMQRWRRGEVGRKFRTKPATD